MVVIPFLVARVRAAVLPARRPPARVRIVFVCELCGGARDLGIRAADELSAGDAVDLLWVHLMFVHGVTSPRELHERDCYFEARQA